MTSTGRSWLACCALGLAGGLALAATQAARPGKESVPPKGPDAAAAAKGKIIYQRYCTSCHGPEGAGDGEIAPELRVPPPDLTRLAARHGGGFPFEEVVRTIDGRKRTRAHGTSEMPVWGEVFQKTSGTESPDLESAVARIAHYLWSIQKPAGK